MVRFWSRLFAIGCCVALSGSASAEGQKRGSVSETRLDYAAAQQLMLSLINRDRA